MLRFLRLYNRWILAVGGTLLLVAWALGGALSTCTSTAAMSGAPWATYGADSETITYGDLEGLRGEMRVLNHLGDRSLQQFGADQAPEHWFLISREAEEAGLVGGEGDGREVMSAVAAMVNARQPAGSTPVDAMDVLSTFMRESQADQKTVLTTLAKVNGVNRLRQIYSSMPRFSDARLRSSAASALDAVAGDVLVLDARKLSVPAIPPATDDTKLQAQLERYGDKLPGQGDFGFGYRLPDRVKLEWIEIREASVRTAIEASGALDTLTLKKRFAENPSKYGAPAGSASDVLSSFSAYEQSVRQRVLDELTTERMNEISKFVSDQLAVSLRGVPRDQAYIVLPNDWEARRPNLQRLAEEIASHFKIEMPVYESTGDNWKTAADLRGMRGIGTSSTTRFGPQPVQFAQLVDKLKEFGHGIDTMPLQKDVVGPPMTSASRDLYFFRVTDADPSRAPKTVDEAREAITADVLAEERYAALERLLPELETLAKQEGIRAVVSQYGGSVEFAPNLREAAPETIAYGIRFANIPGLGNNIDAMREIIRRASALPIDRPASEIPEAERTFVIPLPKSLAVLMVRVTDRFPLTTEDFQMVARNPSIQGALLGEEFRTATLEALSFDALKARHNFRLVRGGDEEGETPSGEAAQSTPGPTPGPTPAG
ncbi:MAG: hypothetical protein SGJ11_14380 [Phycisphaerae bacterium]|nr:hypothetical protein [Phycisphaerae bacterium]